jgi:hypothetical protein
LERATSGDFEVDPGYWRDTLPPQVSGFQSRSGSHVKKAACSKQAAFIFTVSATMVNIKPPQIQKRFSPQIIGR